jgi:hypothetical protein
VESLKKLCEIQNKSFKRRATDQLLPISFSSSTQGMEEDAQEHNALLDQDMIIYITLGKKLKQLEDARHMDRVRMNMYASNKENLQLYLKRIENDVALRERDQHRITTLIKQIDETTETINNASLSTVREINATVAARDHLKATSNAMKEYLGKIITPENNNNNRTEEDTASGYDDEDDEVLEDMNVEGNPQEDENEESYDENRSKEHYQNAQCGECDPNIIIGSRIQVYWKGNKEWYGGTIFGWCDNAKQYIIDYDDSKEDGPILEHLTGPHAENWLYIRSSERKSKPSYKARTMEPPID